jgi:hypothetical protein
MSLQNHSLPLAYIEVKLPSCFWLKKQANGNAYSFYFFEVQEKDYSMAFLRMSTLIGLQTFKKVSVSVHSKTVPDFDGASMPCIQLKRDIEEILISIDK